ncbi:MAG: hypothetical protein HGA66_17175 [Holophaga sp.]|nr:hypothetical protein [Holophaga sp.]
MQTDDATDDDDHDELDRQQKREHLGGDEAHLVREERAREASEHGAQAKGFDLGDGEFDAHGFGLGFCFGDVMK